MIRRTLAAIAIAWFLGFLWFATTLPGPLANGESAVAIVPTGAAGRIERGVDLLESGDVREVLVTGVDSNVTRAEFAEQFGLGEARMDCCITLGYAALDTRGNAFETADWVEERDIDSMRLITSDWHMRRAYGEISRLLPSHVALEQDAVPTEPSLRILFVEYHKWLASTFAAWIGLGL
ncbi:YdcF family protein [Qipengyuania sp. JC766]|uniref:YdcF family protein n=1 Tax=Qipengyuania sp. JC766 TaxID=3232139 RepID=UPI003458E574